MQESERVENQVESPLAGGRETRPHLGGTLSHLWMARIVPLAPKDLLTPTLVVPSRQLLTPDYAEGALLSTQLPPGASA